MSLHVPSPVRQAVLATQGVKAGPVGPGAGVLMTEYLLPNVFPTDPQRKMAKAVQLGTEVAYIRAAEKVISGKVKECPWHLEDPDEVTIDETYPDKRAVAAFDLIRNPQAMLDLREVGVRMTRAQWLEITSRHMGLAGNGVWYLDGRNLFGVPNAILYIRPDRLTPVMDGVVLRSWVLDKRTDGTGTPLDLEDVIHLTLETPNSGIWATGLVESALVKALLNGQVDKHFAQVLASGGRLSGIISPKEGAITDDNVYQTMIRDWRNVTEQPESAKRVQIVRAPIDFTQTVQTIQEMGIIELMTRNRDDLLALWGVPLSQIGGSTPAGLNGGDVRKYDEAALWQNAIHPRLGEIAPNLQNILDLWRPILGWCPRFIFDEPEFDDDSPRYARVGQSVTVALKNRERRDQLGYEPFGPNVYGSTGALLDDEVWVPLNIQPVIGVAASIGGPPDATVTTPNANAAPNEVSADSTVIEPSQSAAIGAVKARTVVTGVQALRQRIDRSATPRLRASVALVLDQQKRDIVSRVLSHFDQIKARPGDVQAWWPRPDHWDKPMADALNPAIVTMASSIETHLRDALTSKGKAMAAPHHLAPHNAQLGSAAEGAATHVIMKGATRVQGINNVTRDGIRNIIREGVAAGLSPREVGDRIEAWTGWDEYRAERIATTELAAAYNAAALSTYGDLGVQLVEASDGDEDDECRERLARDNGYGPGIYTIAQADDEDEHPNGTLDWLPVV